MNGADAWMVQCRSRARFAAEAFESERIISKVRRQELQSDEPAQFEILGLVDHAHPSTTKLFQNPVMGNGLADHEIHETARTPRARRFLLVVLYTNQRGLHRSL